MINMKKIYISILSFIVIILVFSTATYAWISMAAINNLDGLSLSATTGEDLLISLDGINYYNKIPSELLFDLTNKITLYDLTTDDGINFSFGEKEQHKEVIKNKHYVSFTIYFQTASREHNIYLINNRKADARYDNDVEGTYVVSRGVTWKSKHTFQDGPNITNIVQKGEAKTFYASDAVRIGFIELLDDTNELDTRDQSELITFVYDPSENEEMSYGKLYGAHDYYFQGNGKYPDFPESYIKTSYRLTNTLRNNPYQAEDDESLITVLQPTGKYRNDMEIYQGKVMINIWIDGWDANSYDLIKEDLIKIQLQFKALLGASD